MCRKAVLSVWVWLFCVPFGIAQTTATISGVVRDATGAVVPGVSVTVRNVETGIARTLPTDAEGRYRAPSLSVGRYEVQASMAGFQTAVRSGIELTVAREAVVNLMLEVGQVTERVEVTGEAPLVETTTSSVGGLVEGTQITNLPLNGRSFDELTLLQPGVALAKFQTRQLQGGFSTKMSLRGARPEQNSFLLDGTDVMGPTNGIPGSVGGQSFGVDAVREFRVETGTFSAQYGRAAGGVINVVTKSGTNELHGTAFEFLRNDNLDARNFFDEDKPEFKRNQFGASLGGPIIKDKTFFFGSYEGLRDRLGRTLIGTVPTANARKGDLDGNGVAEIAVNSRVTPYLNALYPLPNGRDFRDGTAEFVRGDNEPTDEDFFTVRVDHNFSSNDTFFVRYTFDDGERVTPGDLPVFGEKNVSRNQFVTVEETHIFSPNVLNTFRLGYNRTKVGLLPLITGVDDATLQNLAFVPGIPLLTKGTVLDPGGGLTSLGNANSPRVWVWNLYEGSDDVNLTKGNHSFKFGGLFKTILFVQREAKSAGGEYELGSLAAFLQGNATAFRALLPGAVSDNAWRYHYFGWYVQDDWRVNSRLSVNLGLRHEFYTGPRDRTDRWCNLPTLFSTVMTCASDDGKGSAVDPGFAVWDTGDMGANRNFGPRVGFAWDVFGDGKTSLRGGFGRFFDALSPLWWQSPASGSFPALSDAQLSNPPFPNANDLISAGGGAIPPSSTILGVWGGAATPESMQWNLTIQRQIGGDAVFTIGYLGSVGRHLWLRANENTRQWTLRSDGRKFFSRSAPRRNPIFGDTRRVRTESNSSYNGLIMSFQKRFSSGLQFQTSYTFSKSLDTGSNITNNSNAGGTGGTTLMDADDWRRDRSRSDFDVRNNLSVNAMWQLPFGPGRMWGSRLSGAAAQILGGWQLGGVLKAASSSALTVDDSSFAWSDNGNTNRSERPDLVAGASQDPIEGVTSGCTRGGRDFAGGQNLGTPDLWLDPCAFQVQTRGFYGNLGRNTVSSPDQVNVDLSLLKDFNVPQISEQFRVQFRAEFFNILNRANFGVPAVRVFDRNGRIQGNFGRITTTSTKSREIQFGLKFLW
ncbi:MAG: TonB-dependent receptor [Acidobacteria bacterium]|nr:TonB-dependent receptor [Acidobacteriota bacterium]